MKKNHAQYEQKYYIAFSINGTNCFITAERIIKSNIPLGNDVHIDGIRYIGVPSRRPKWTPNDGIKLFCEELCSKSGNPLRSPPAILKVFNKLEKNGWTIKNKDNFIKRHWNKK